MTSPRLSRRPASSSRASAFAAATVLGALLLSSAARAQNPTATLSGTVSADGTGLPGVSVTVRSPSLQGSRSAVTGSNGGYVVPLLPPGDYVVTFELSGFETATRPIKLAAARADRLDATLRLTGVAAETSAIATADSIAEGATASMTLTQETIEKLPVARTFASAVTLSPGVNPSGPSGQITINGSMSFENLFLVNGVVVNENLRGQPLNLFIEDAVQETTTSVSGISAEYGRFGGGVVNVITKSGGNTFSGSFRTAFTNDDWRSLRDFHGAAGQKTDTTLDKTIPQYEATLGGPFWRDHVWFFAAGRSVRQEFSAQTAAPVSASFVTGVDQQRFEGKLTVTPIERLSLVGSYLDLKQTDLGNAFPSATGIYDLASVYDRQTPQELVSVNASGTLSSNLFLEAQYSARQFTFKNSGAPSQDIVDGTLLIDNTRAIRYFSPTFCGVCSDEKRDNDDLLLKGSLFLTTKSAGSHNVVAGIDRFNDKRFADNHQSGSDYRILGQSVIVRNGTVYPQWGSAATGNSPTQIQWNPILKSSQGAEFITYSAFLNDTWRVASNLSLNLGVRWDKNDGTDGGGAKVVDDSKLSPRLGVDWDVFGNGDLQVKASWARYVASIANSQADAGSLGGQPATLLYDYRGPAINPDPNAPILTSSADALRILWAWFAANGGTNRPLRGNPTIPGVNPSIASGLASPNTDELTLGALKRLGTRGVVRVDGVYRKSADFYGVRTDTSTGKVQGTINGVTRTLDRQLIVNTDAVERRYYGMNLAVSYRFFEGLRFDGNWTWSHAIGNFDGETAASGPIATAVPSYPEYFDVAWSNPVGDLAIDRRHKARAWLVYDLPFSGRTFGVSASVLQSYDSGAPYGAVGTVATGPFVSNPGYLGAPATVNYYYTGRSAFRTDDVHQTDVSLNVSLRPWKSVEIFAQPELLNAFANQAVTTVSASTLTPVNTPGTYAAFNPFAATPVLGTNWAYNTTFGRPTSPASYQTPRTFRFSVGLRF